MSPSTHVALQIILSLLGGLAGFIAHIVLSLFNTISSPMLSMVVFFLLVGVGSIVPRLVMLWIPARCPKCSERAYCRGSVPITFVCGTCGHTHDTGISMRSSDS